MQIDRFSVFRFSLSLHSSVRVLPTLILDRRNGILLRLMLADGSLAWGEASPLPGFSRESLDDVIAAVPHVLSSVVGREISAESMRDELVRDGRSTTLPSLDFALASALMVAEARTDRKAGRLQTRFRRAPRVTVARLLQGSVAETAEEAAMAARAGYRCIKIKVGRIDVDDEVKMVGSVREAVGPDVAIRLDANQSWSRQEAIRFGNRVSAFNIEFLEEPVAAPEGLQEVCAEIGVPVAIDESLKVNRHLIDAGIVAAAILKPTVLGATTTSDLVGTCLSSGVLPVFSCSYESGVGTFAVGLMSVLMSDRAAAVGMGTHAYLKDDLLTRRVAFAAPEVEIERLFDSAMNVNTSLLATI